MANEYFEPIKDKVESLLSKRKSDLFIAYITGDRRPVELLSTKIAVETVPFFYEILKKNGHKKKITLFLYSNGGELEAPWALANLIREHCRWLEIIIPYKAFSAATLLSLAADKILMTPLSMLSPIDPAGNFSIQNEPKTIQVEDITGYIDFVKEKVGLVEQNSLTESLKSLSNQVPPVVLGSVNRTHSLVRQIAAKMLSLTKTEYSEIESKTVINNLTKELFSHKHYISRNEAKEIGLKSIDIAKKDEESLVNEIYDFYVDKLKLNEIFNPTNHLTGEETQNTVSLDRAVITSSNTCFVFKTDAQITKTSTPDNRPNLNVNFEEKGWVKI